MRKNLRIHVPERFSFGRQKRGISERQEKAGRGIEDGCLSAAAGKQVRHNQVNRLDLFERFDQACSSLARRSIDRSILMVAFIVN